MANSLIRKALYRAAIEAIERAGYTTTNTESWATPPPIYWYGKQTAHLQRILIYENREIGWIASVEITHNITYVKCLPTADPQSAISNQHPNYINELIKCLP